MYVCMYDVCLYVCMYAYVIYYACIYHLYSIDICRVDWGSINQA